MISITSNVLNELQIRTKLIKNICEPAKDASSKAAKRTTGDILSKSQIIWIDLVCSIIHQASYTEKEKILDNYGLASSLYVLVKICPYSEIYKILSATHSFILSDPKIKNPTKIKFVNSFVFDHLISLFTNTEKVNLDALSPPLDYNSFTKVDQSQSVASPIVDSISDICFRFLKSITCKKGFVLSFSKLNNYNPSQYFDPSQAYNNLNVPFGSNETEVSSEKDSISATVNSLHIKKFIPIDRYQLFHALTFKIKHLETKRHSTLSIEILKNNPELISSFWKKVKLSLEPRLSTLYLVNIGFVLKVLSINIDLFNQKISPVSKKFINKEHTSSISSPNCPQVPQIIDYILPCSFNRLLLSKGVQFTSSPLIQYMNLNIIGHSMKKLDQFRNWIQHNIKSIENSNHINFGLESSSQLVSHWKLLDSRLLQTVKRRLPEWSVILSIYRNFQSTTSVQKACTASNGTSNIIDYSTSSKTLILESLLRVISGYVKNFPDWILESRFDIGKLLSFEPSYLFDSSARISSGLPDSDPNMKFKNLIFYHVLECVAKSPSDLISWNGTTNIPSSKDSNEYINYPKYNFGIAIMIYLTKSGIVKASSKNVLVKALSEVNSTHATSFSTSSNLNTSTSNDLNSHVNSAWLDSLEIASNCSKSGAINFNRISNLVSLAEKAIISTSTSLYKFIDFVKNWSSDITFDSSLFELLNSGPGIMASIILQTWLCVL
ncbi:hypothetical protein AYI69_g4809 [Smittium culicis]|uniref:URB1 N-terminal domain-containing protein n=1 Tax=Smittium culicis TaxID=133412 RepID=A0A1R1Y8M8_9FUNG|nr:hypothetical protein AYI69_g5131 [Smittium culicis]OMJ23954.1 hypothetical protein AYI69_g4809 [Smittium culicis]